MERTRIESVDLLRGIFMILMTLDHTRDFLGVPVVNPTDLSQTSAALFLTRWITISVHQSFFYSRGRGRVFPFDDNPGAICRYFSLSAALTHFSGTGRASCGGVAIQFRLPVYYRVMPDTGAYTGCSSHGCSSHQASGTFRSLSRLDGDSAWHGRTWSGAWLWSRFIPHAGGSLISSNADTMPG
jgi:hypothetical protein